jgi:thiol-disulfide isomerase/thioredoxin
MRPANIGLIISLAAFGLGGCRPSTPPSGQQAAKDGAPASTEPIPVLPVLGKAPELTNSVWLNTDPLRLSILRGKVVLIDFWTFGCINCQHVIPSLKSWDARYASKGLTIVGNHYPEFGYEADLQNLEQAIQREGISYPVSQDNHGDTWRSYGIHYWPTLVLIDKQGRIRYRHIVEGAYTETEQAIRALLSEPGPG